MGAPFFMSRIKELEMLENSLVEFNRKWRGIDGQENF